MSIDVVLPVDHAERQRALDPQQSFIVQAPAGSGKTHLLIQRFLKLLTCVDEPEQIVAITFTVKAAGEMRERVLEALERARQGIEPVAAHEVSMAALAAAAVARDRERGWDLEHFPARLRVTTIDALNRQLSSAAPLIAGGLSLNAIAADPDILYRKAANRLLNWMTEDEQIGAAVKAVLRHLDNNVDRFESLVAQMLSQREQWLPILGTGALSGNDAVLGQREALEEYLCEIITAELESLDLLMPLDVKTALHELLPFSVAAVLDTKYAPIAPNWMRCEAFPAPDAASLVLWQELTNVLLTNTGGWRKTVDTRQGFPSKTREKDRILAIIGDLRDGADGDAVLAGLNTVRSLPPCTIADSQWDVLGHLLLVLPLAVVELREVFREHGEADFSEVAIEARAALGRSDEPSDLALAMDCKLQHILLDEFQDTSVSQYDLLKLLIRGWVPGDGRSVFLVGDPMQSIYRFRQAEVSNFLEVAEQGIHTGEGYWFKPTPLRLQANFRSAPAVVDWVNNAFIRILPEHNDVLTGAVTFSASVANKPAEALSGIHWQVLNDNTLDVEAAEVVTQVEALLHNPDTADDSIGILVRGRRHAAGIANLLRTRGIDFAGKDLEHMADIPLVQDLLSLTRALLHPADRLAWTALLRAPWCGLLLEDLHALLAADRKAPVWQLLAADDLSTTLSADALQRVSALVTALSAGFSRRGRLPLCDWIEGVWHSLGGPASAREPNEMLAAEAYFRFLEAETDSDDIADTAELLKKLQEKPVSFSNPDAQVQIMTIHKAKGLEFDSVMLPSLGRKTRHSDKPVLAWKQVPRPSGDTGLLLAPVEQFGAGADPLFSFIARINTAQEAAEYARLLYVAVTRARKRLYPYVHLKQDKQGAMSGPAKNSLAYCMMAIIDSEVPLPDASVEATTAKQPVWQQPDLRRFSAGWQAPLPESAVASALKHAIQFPDEPVTFDWASPLARVVGTVVHGYLEQMALQGIDSVSYSALVCSALLAEQGVADAELEQGVSRVVAALDNACADATARWLLSGEHISAASELAITLSENGLTGRKVVDRTFVTADGERWIVDYKTSVHRGSDTAAFVDNEVVRYREQLEGYRAAMRSLYPTETTQARLGLYFPGLNVFREVV